MCFAILSACLELGFLLSLCGLSWGSAFHLCQVQFINIFFYVHLGTAASFGKHPTAAIAPFMSVGRTQLGTLCTLISEL